MKFNIKRLIKKINGVMDEIPQTFDNKNAKYYRTEGEKFRNEIAIKQKTIKNEENKTTNKMNFPNKGIEK